MSKLAVPAPLPDLGRTVTHQAEHALAQKRLPGDRRAAKRSSRWRRPESGGEAPVDREAWERRHVARLALTDLIVLTFAVLIALITKFGTTPEARAAGLAGLGYAWIGVLIVVVWWLSLIFFRSRDQRLFGEDAEEYRRVIRATVFTFSLLAIVSLLVKADLSRGYLAIAFPLGIVGLLASRKAWRRWLARQRLHGLGLARVLMIGGERSSLAIAQSFDSNKAAGFRVTGVWVPDHHHEKPEWLDVSNRFVPVLGTERTLAEALTLSNANTVIITDTEHLGHDGLRDLMWQLEGAKVDLLVSPNMVDIAGARLHMRGISGMSFLHLEEPQYAAAGSWPKALFDRCGAAALLMMLSPLMCGVAIVVKCTSPGGVFFRHERIGRDGAPFKMIKFRSMRSGADTELQALLKAQGTADKPLFKVTNDPRITGIGGFIRRFSIDELPQLLNVLKGDMSLVGPRPQQAAEVALYDDAAHRRLHVRPGMTGLWQVSGRSDLSWEEAIRLDTSYVENWSMTGDLTILWRTVRAVIRSDGAY